MANVKPYLPEMLPAEYFKDESINTEKNGVKRFHAHAKDLHAMYALNLHKVYKHAACFFVR